MECCRYNFIGSTLNHPQIYPKYIQNFSADFPGCSFRNSTKDFFRKFYWDFPRNSIRNSSRDRSGYPFSDFFDAFSYFPRNYPSHLSRYSYRNIPWNIASEIALLISSGIPTEVLLEILTLKSRIFQAISGGILPGTAADSSKTFFRSSSMNFSRNFIWNPNWDVVRYLNKSSSNDSSRNYCRVFSSRGFQ